MGPGAQARQMSPGRGVKDTLAQAAPAAAVQGGSWIVMVLGTETDGVKCTQPQVTTQTWEHGHLTSRHRDSGVSVHHGHRVYVTGS